jgi:hypothetical protein
MWWDGGGVGAEVGPISFAAENCVSLSEFGGFDTVAFLYLVMPSSFLFMGIEQAYVITTVIILMGHAGSVVG